MRIPHGFSPPAMRIPHGFLLATMTLAMAAAVPATGSVEGTLQQEPMIRRTLSVAPGGRLTVDADFGHIDVTTHDADTVTVTVDREVRERYEDDADRILAEHRVDISSSGNDVTVNVEVSDDDRERWRDAYRNTPLRVEIDVVVPREYDVDLETAGGHIEVSDLRGELRAETAGGHLELGNIDGTVRARTAGGHIGLRGSSGDVDVHTSGGHIEIGDVGGRVVADTSGGHIEIGRSAGEVRAETSGGGIEIDEVGGTVVARTSGGSIRATITEQPGGDCRLSTSGGSVTVYLAEDIGVDLDASAAGSVDVDFAVTGTVRRSSVRGSINGGGPELRLRTSGGSISVRRR